MANAEEVIALLPKLVGKKVLVIGDVMLDEYIPAEVTCQGDRTIIKAVAAERYTRPGGAANVAVNVRSLGGVPVLEGLVGRGDATGMRLEEKLAELEALDHLLTAEEGRWTTKKTYYSRKMRVDVECTRPASNESQNHLINNVARFVPNVDAVVLSDYGKGVCTPLVCRTAAKMAKTCGIPSLADPYGRDWTKFFGVTLLKPTLEEDYLAHRSDENLAPETSLLITRGPQGMTLGVPPKRSWQLYEALAKDAVDVTGAGDTVMAMMSLAMAAKIPLEQAALLASAAAAVVVRKPGTATVTIDEVRAVLSKLPKMA